MIIRAAGPDDQRGQVGDEAEQGSFDEPRTRTRRSARAYRDGRSPISPPLATQAQGSEIRCSRITWENTSWAVGPSCRNPVTPSGARYGRASLVPGKVSCGAITRGENWTFDQDDNHQNDEADRGPSMLQEAVLRRAGEAHGTGHWRTLRVGRRMLRARPTMERSRPACTVDHQEQRACIKAGSRGS